MGGHGKDGLPKRVAIVGAGTMGHALAVVHALGGCRVRLTDADAGALARAERLIGAALATLAGAGAIAADDAAEATARISTVASLPDAVAEADLVVEAVVEQSEAKRSVFAAIDAAAPADAILASNTSYLDVFPLIPSNRQARATIAHWYTPPYILDLVDIVPGPETAPEVTDTLARLYRRCGKAPLVSTTLVPGYVANRLQAALNLECLRMIDEGWADAREIDRAIRHGLVLRLAVMGHMRKMDFTGLEMVRNGIASGTYRPPEATGRSPVLDRLIAEGRRGVAAGAGFYEYGGEDPVALYAERDRRLLAAKVALAGVLEDGDDHG